MGTNEVSWYEPHFTFCFPLQPPNQERFGSMSISGHCQIILKKRMPRTKKPNREKKIKVKIKTSDKAKPLNIAFPLSSMQLILRYVFLILLILF